MPKKEWTDEERKAFAEKMKASRQKAKQEKEPQKEPAIINQDTQTDVRNEDYDTLKAQVDELRSLLLNREQATQGQQAPQITATGMIGTLHKYNTDPAYYPDPSARLAKDPRLARFAFGENWELEYSVRTTEYTTLDNRRVSEPQFTVQLIGKMFDEDGELTPGRYVRKQIIFFEDPDSALTVARENGVDPQAFGGDKPFLDEMRYLRIRDWLLENFYPNSATSKRENKRQMVIDNQVVEYFEVSSQNPSTLKFGDLNGKVKA